MRFFGYRSRKPWKMFLASFVYVLILMIIVIAIINPSSEPAGGEASNKIEAMVNDKLGASTNNDKPTYIKHKDNGNWFYLHLNTSDNLTTDMMKLSMYDDMTKLFPALFKKTKATNIQIIWHATFVDQKGNESDGVLMRTMFSRKNAETVKWGNVNPENIPSIADGYSDQFKK